MTKTNNETGQHIFNPSMLDILYRRSLKEIEELKRQVGYWKRSYLSVCKNYKKEVNK